MRRTVYREGLRCLAAMLLMAVILVTSAEQVLHAATIQDVSVGFEGLYKVGYWTPVRVTLNADAEHALEGRLRFTTRDGDGAEVSYSDESGPPLTIQPGEAVTVSRNVKFGRVQTELTVELIGSDELVVLRRTLGREEFTQPQVSDTSITLTLGPPVGIQELFAAQTGRENRPLSCRLTDDTNLPRDWLAYESVDSIVVTTRDNSLFESLDDEQVAAIRQWVAMGGRLLLSVGSRGEEMLADQNSPATTRSAIQRLAAFVPGKFVAVTEPRDTAALESYAGSTLQLLTDDSSNTLPLTVVKNVPGIVELSETGAWGVQPLVVRAPFGFGEVVFTAFDLDSPLMENWAARSSLLVRLLRDDASATEQVGPSRFGGRVAHVGFTDLSGQLRSALDQFSNVSFVPFYAMAGIVLVYVLLIGPGDYFLLKSVVKRMERTWFTFPLIVISFSVLAVYLFTTLKQTGLQINQVDLVDVDLESRTVRGAAWADVYSPRTETYSLEWQPSAIIEPLVQESHHVASWHGLPGTGLGGLNTAHSAPQFTNPYEILLSGYSSRLEDTPIQISATKHFQVRWWAETALRSTTNLTVDDRSQLLIGEIVNPLPVALEDCKVLFGDWLYRLDGTFGRLDAGERFRIESERPLNLEWKLTRRRVEDSQDVSTPWNQSSFDVPRIFEMMMFHDAAGGESYTELSHRFQSFVDLSHLLRHGRAILLGRSEQRPTDLRVDGEIAEAQFDATWTYYRIVFPVQTESED